MSRNRPTILVADDDPSILTIVSRVLQLNGYFVVTAQDGTAALELEHEMQPILAILDVRMPAMDGISVCRRIRDRSDVPVIILTALEDEMDAARALEAGADDYVRKPFGTDELVARVRAVLRRAGNGAPGAARLEAGPLVVDEHQRQVTLLGRELQLSRTEFCLLDFLVRNPNRVLTHDQLLEGVWGREYVGSHHLLRVAVSRLRQKLEGTGGELIETLSGVGYRFRKKAA